MIKFINTVGVVPISAVGGGKSGIDVGDDFGGGGKLSSSPRIVYIINNRIICTLLKEP